MATNQCQSRSYILKPCRYLADSVLYRQVSGEQLVHFPSCSSSTSDYASNRRKAPHKSKNSCCFKRGPLLVQVRHEYFRFSQWSCEIWKARRFGVSNIICSRKYELNLKKIRIESLYSRYADSKCQYVFDHIRVYINLSLLDSA